MYAAPSIAAALGLVSGIGEAAKALDHYPDVDWRRDHVFVRTTTHGAGEDVTAKDTTLAERISALATAAGARAAAALLDRTVEIGIDCTDPDALESAWTTALGYRRIRAGNLEDPWGRGPAIWFQRSETPAASRLHVDVYVAPETATDVVDAVESNGGRRLDERFAPSWWVMADAEGNRFCVCTPYDPPVD